LRVRLIVGLGNPGPEYAGTRHNAGFWVVEAVAAGSGLKFKRQGMAARARGLVAGREVVLAKPQAFMNRSGPVVAELIDGLGLDLHDVIVIHDDLDLDPGRVRLKARGGHGGHNGVLSIINTLGTDRFARLKLGVGRPPAGQEAADYVLTPVPSRERAVLDKTVEQAVLALECWVSEGLAAAMNRFNVKRETSDR
jgi:PTH1 family peptidyl-tRNA hydrolase